MKYRKDTTIYFANLVKPPEHGLWTPGEEIVFTARPNINSHSQIFKYDRSIFCLPHRPKLSDFFDLCLHWVSVVRVYYNHLKPSLDYLSCIGIQWHCTTNIVVVNPTKLFIIKLFHKHCKLFVTVSCPHCTSY